MPRRIPFVLLIALLLSCVSFAKKKNKQELPDLVLNAQTVLVVIHPDAGEPVTNPTANRTAQENVENALTKWGRFHLVMSPQTPGLSDPGLGPQDRGPHMSNDIGSSEDSFEVYLGGVEYPLDASPIWRYMGKNALDTPTVAAVSQFRKAIAESEKQRQQKP